jgi:hypothetical protein
MSLNILGDVSFPLALPLLDMLQEYSLGLELRGENGAALYT